MRATAESAESKTDKREKGNRKRFSQTARETQIISRCMRMLDTSFSHPTARDKDDSQEKLSRKNTLNQEQLDDVEILFLAKITTNVKVTKQLVRQTMQETFSLMDFVNDETVVKAVYDRVRYLQGKHVSFSISKIEDAYTFTKEWAETLSLMVVVQHLNPQEQNGLKKTPRSSRTPLTVGKNNHQSPPVRNTWAHCYENVRNMFKNRK